MRPEQTQQPEQPQRTEQFQRPEQTQRPEPAAQAAPVANATSSQVQAPASASPAGGHADVEVLRRAWPEVLQTLTKIKRSTWALVEPNAQVGRFDGQVLTLVFTTSGLAGAFGRADHSENLRQAIHKTIGIDCQITAVAGAGSSASSEPNPKARTSRDVPATTTDADWGITPVAAGPVQPESATGRQGTTGSTTGSADRSADSAAGQATQPAPDAPAVSAPQWSGPNITASPSGAASPAAGQAAPPSPDAPAVSAPQWSGPNITASPSPTATSDTAAMGGTGSTRGEPGSGGPATARQSASPSAAQPVAAQPAPQPAVPEEPARGPQAGDYSYPDDDWGPPQDEDAPPLEEEPPMDWEPSFQWQGRPASPSAPETSQTAESAPSAPQIRANSAGSAPSALPPRPETSADPWSRAVEQTPGVWLLGSESNVGTSVAAADQRDEEAPGAAAPDYPPAAAQPPHGGGARPTENQPPAAWGVSAQDDSTPGDGAQSGSAFGDNAPGTGAPSVPDGAPAYAMASAPAAAGHEYGAPTPAQGVRAPAVTTAPDATQVRVPVFAAGTGPAIQAGTVPAGPAIQAGPAVAAARTAAPAQESEAPARGKLSLYQRLSNSPEAEAGRAKAPARSVEEPAPYVQDIPSADDETIEESGVFGRAAVERILGGKLVEERSLDGSPLMPRY